MSTFLGTSVDQDFHTRQYFVAWQQFMHHEIAVRQRSGT
jgi:hypothetical protein